MKDKDKNFDISVNLIKEIERLVIIFKNIFLKKINK